MHAETPETIDHAVKLADAIDAMPDAAIYYLRMSIAHIVDRLNQNAREYSDHAETRARGAAMRESAERITARLERVTRP